MRRPGCLLETPSFADRPHDRGALAGMSDGCCSRRRAWRATAVSRTELHYECTQPCRQTADGAGPQLRGTPYCCEMSRGCPCSCYEEGTSALACMYVLIGFPSSIRFLVIICARAQRVQRVGVNVAGSLGRFSKDTNERRPAYGAEQYAADQNDRDVEQRTSHATNVESMAAAAGVVVMSVVRNSEVTRRSTVPRPTAAAPISRTPALRTATSRTPIRARRSTLSGRRARGRWTVRLPR